VAGFTVSPVGAWCRRARPFVRNGGDV